MSNCKYKTPCGICRVKTDADANPLVVHYCDYPEKCEDNPFTSLSCPSCGNSMWGYENGRIVCAVCGNYMGDMRGAKNEFSQN